MLHLISLNKYVVALIVNQGNSCPIYFMIVSLFLAMLNGLKIIPLLEKIILLVRYVGSGVMRKFVVSSIMGCVTRSNDLEDKVSSFSFSFSLFVLSHCSA